MSRTGDTSLNQHSPATVEASPGTSEAENGRAPSPDLLAAAKRFYASLKASGESFFLSNQVQNHLDDFLAADTSLPEKTRWALRRTFRECPEVILDGDSAFAVLRPGVGRKQIVRIHPELDHLEEIDRGQFLQIKDAYVQGHHEATQRGLVIDFSPFFRDYSKVRESSEIGEGLSFLNRQLSAQLYQNPELFRRASLDFLRNRTLNGVNILVNDHLSTPQILRKELIAARAMLEDYAADEPYERFAHELRGHGFEPGWGRTTEDVAENLALLSRVLESSDPARFEKLLMLQGD